MTTETSPATLGATTRRLARLALPLVVFGLVQTLVVANDALLLGSAGAEAITSAGAASAVAMVAIFFFMGLGGTGGQILVSRAWGAGDHAAARAVVAQGVRLALLIGLPTLLVLGIVAPWLLELVGDTAIDTELSAAMLRILLPGILAAAIGSVLRGFANGAGETRIVLVASLVAAVVDVGTSVSLLLAGLGPIAVSIGTTLGTTASTLTLMAWSGRRHRRGGQEPGWRQMLGRGAAHRVSPPGGSTAENWRVGWPEALLGATSAGAGVVVTLVLATSLPAHLAAARTVEATTMLAWTVIAGVGTAGLTLLGQALGAQDTAAYRRALTAMLLTGGAASLALLAAGPPLTLLYLTTTFTPDVVAAAESVLWLAWVQVPWILGSTLLLGICRSHKDTKASMWASLVSEYGAFLPAGWLLCRVLELGVRGLFYAHHIYWVAFYAVVLPAALRHLRRLGRSPEQTPVGQHPTSRDTDRLTTGGG